jgi:hypothetical protein
MASVGCVTRKLRASCLTIVAALLAVAVLVVPGPVVAAWSVGSISDDDRGPIRTLGDHSTRGIVQAIAESSMVISRPHHRGSMTFNLTPSTRREGAVVVGSTVSVRYREDGKTRIATAVALQRKD